MFVIHSDGSRLWDPLPHCCVLSSFLLHPSHALSYSPAEIADVVTSGLASWLPASLHSSLPCNFPPNESFTNYYFLHVMLLFRNQQRSTIVKRVNFLQAQPSRPFKIWYQTYIPNLHIPLQSPHRSSLHLSDWSVFAICTPVTQLSG